MSLDTKEVSHPILTFDMNWKYQNVMDAAIKPSFDPQLLFFGSFFLCVFS